MDIISVVLGADTKKDRTRDSIKIIEYAFASYRMVDLEFMLHDEFDNIVENTEFSVNKGINNDLRLKLEENNISVYPVEKERVKDVNVRSRTKHKLSCTSKGRRCTSEKSQ